MASIDRTTDGHDHLIYRDCEYKNCYSCREKYYCHRYDDRPMKWCDDYEPKKSKCPQCGYEYDSGK